MTSQPKLLWKSSMIRISTKKSWLLSFLELKGRPKRPISAGIAKNRDIGKETVQRKDDQQISEEVEDKGHVTETIGGQIKEGEEVQAQINQVLPLVQKVQQVIKRWFQRSKKESKANVNIHRRRAHLHHRAEEAPVTRITLRDPLQNLELKENDFFVLSEFWFQNIRVVSKGQVVVYNQHPQAEWVLQNFQVFPPH